MLLIIIVLLTCVLDIAVFFRFTREKKLYKPVDRNGSVIILKNHDYLIKTFPVIFASSILISIIIVFLMLENREITIDDYAMLFVVFVYSAGNLGVLAVFMHTYIEYDEKEIRQYLPFRKNPKIIQWRNMAAVKVPSLRAPILTHIGPTCKISLELTPQIVVVYLPFLRQQAQEHSIKMDSRIDML